MKYIVSILERASLILGAEFLELVSNEKDAFKCDKMYFVYASLRLKQVMVCRTEVVAGNQLCSLASSFSVLGVSVRFELVTKMRRPSYFVVSINVLIFQPRVFCLTVHSTPQRVYYLFLALQNKGMFHFIRKVWISGPRLTTVLILDDCVADTDQQV